MPFWTSPLNLWVSQTPTTMTGASALSQYTQPSQTVATTTAGLYSLYCEPPSQWRSIAATTAAQWRWISGSGETRLFTVTVDDGIASPAVIISRAERERRDALAEQQAYQRAMAEHDEQEVARLARAIAARAVATEAQVAARAERQRRADEERAVRNVAAERARGLLLEHLTPEQRETFVANGWFVVSGGKSKTRYRIRAVESMVANIDVLDQERVSHRLCGHVPRHHVPLGDQLLAQKIMLELAEPDFLRIANRHAA